MSAEGTTQFVKAEKEHAVELAAGLPEEERESLRAQVGDDAESVLVNSVAMSEKAIAVVGPDGMVEMLYGVIRSKSNPMSGQIWFVMRPEALRNRLADFAHFHSKLKETMEGFDVVFNFMDARKKDKQGWVRWLGFERLGAFEPSYSPGYVFWFYARCPDAETRRRYEEKFEMVKSSASIEPIW